MTWTNYSSDFMLKIWGKQEVGTLCSQVQVLMFQVKFGSTFALIFVVTATSLVVVSAVEVNRYL